jgi:hypothetical protein
MNKAKKYISEGDGVNGYALPFLTPIPFLATLGLVLAWLFNLILMFG